MPGGPSARRQADCVLWWHSQRHGGQLGRMAEPPHRRRGLVADAPCRSASVRWRWHLGRHKPHHRGNGHGQRYAHPALGRRAHPGPQDGSGQGAGFQDCRGRAHPDRRGQYRGLAADGSATAITYDIRRLQAAGTTAILRTSSRQTPKGKYAVSATALQQMGTYELSSNLALAKNTAFSMRVNGANLGTLQLNGAALDRNGVRYTLKTTGRQVNLTLTALQGVLRKGAAGADRLVGTARGDIFYGGAGNDTIRGGGGRDVAVYDTRSWGRDTIAQTNGTMTLLFSGLTARDIVQTRKGTNMILTRTSRPSQRITITNWNDATHNIVFGGKLSAFSKYLAAPTAAQQTRARTEVWKKTGLLAQA